jgi:hypothetical protein
MTRKVTVDGRDLVPIDAAMEEFHIGRATLFRHLEAGTLTRYGRPMGDRRTYVSRAEIRRLVTLQRKQAVLAEVEQTNSAFVGRNVQARTKKVMEQMAAEHAARKRRKS